MTIVQTVSPTGEPLTLSDAKDHLRVADTNSDALIASLITVARTQIEMWTRRQLLTATYRMTLDRFPGNGWWYDADGRFYRSWNQTGRHRFHTIFIPRPPLQSVTSIQYVDGLGATQTLASSAYQTDLDGEPGRIIPVFGTIWPPTLEQLNAVTVTFVAGWTSENIPATVGQLMKLLVAHYYEHREGMGQQELKIHPMAIQSLTAALSYGDYR